MYRILPLKDRINKRLSLCFYEPIDPDFPYTHFRSFRQAILGKVRFNLAEIYETETHPAHLYEEAHPLTSTARSNRWVEEKLILKKHNLLFG